MDNAPSFLQSTTKIVQLRWNSPQRRYGDAHIQAPAESFFIHFPQHDGPSTSNDGQLHDLGERFRALAESQGQEPSAEVVSIRGREEKGRTDAQSLFFPTRQPVRFRGTRLVRSSVLHSPSRQGHHRSFCSEEMDAFRLADQRIFWSATRTVPMRSRLWIRRLRGQPRRFQSSCVSSSAGTSASPDRCCCSSSSSTSSPATFHLRSCAEACLDAPLSTSSQSKCPRSAGTSTRAFRVGWRSRREIPRR
mmetsp:Transcript_10945/g.67638  ORF Transcript_10945/g.67638 Transcript_10945/m.67638 type:complete len:248 (+) Transcript_10945:335-1078(+)